jgi:hypothetical protein
MTFAAQNRVSLIPYMHYPRLLTYFLVFSLLLFNCPNFFAQSLIVGIPSADAAPEGTLEFTHESQFYTEGKPRKWNSFNILCYGMGAETELTATLNNLNNLNNKDLAFGAGIKKIFKPGGKTQADWRLTTGGNLLFSLRTNEIGGWAYSHISRRIPATKTRLTAGFSYGSHQQFGYRMRFPESSGMTVRENLTPLCFIGGIEQQLFGNWSFIADWYSGTHNLADFIPAIQYRLGHQIFIAGYKFPNPGSGGKSAIIFECMLSMPDFLKK